MYLIKKLVVNTAKIMTKFQISLPKTLGTPFSCISFCFTRNRKISKAMLKVNITAKIRKERPKRGPTYFINAILYSISLSSLFPIVLTIILLDTVNSTRQTQITAVMLLNTLISILNLLLF